MKCRFNRHEWGLGFVEQKVGGGVVSVVLEQREGKTMRIPMALAAISNPKHFPFF